MELEFSESTLLNFDKNSLHYQKLETAFNIADSLLRKGYYDKFEADSEFKDLIFAIEQYNYAYIELLRKDLNPEAAAFVRIQVDNLIYLYAEFLHPHRVLNKVYNKGMELSKVKIANKPIISSEILKQIEERFSGVKAIWNRYCNFIHPSNLYIRLKYSENLESETIPDLVYLNQVITTVLLETFQPYEDELKQKGLFEEYQTLFQEELTEFKEMLYIEEESQPTE